MPAIICPHCGVTNRAYSNFCNNCGADLRAYSVDRTKTTQDPASQEETDTGPRLLQDRELPPDNVELADQTDETKTDSDPPTDADSSKDEAPLSEEDVDHPHAADDQFQLNIGGALDANPDIIALVKDENQLTSARAVDLVSAESRTEIPDWQQLLPDSPKGEEIRAIMNEDPQLENRILELGFEDNQSLRLPWIFLTLIAGLLFVLGFRIDVPVGSIVPLPGVPEAFQRIDNLPEGANVLILWSYDPASAGEMDLVVEPIMEHLVSKNANLAMVSSLPYGPAVARQLWRTLTDSPNESQNASFIDLGFLPGGAAALPVLAYTDVLGLLRYGVREFGAGSSIVRFWQRKPDLMLVFAAQAEDVQNFLEQVQPLNDASVVAVASAGADPVLRPYLNSAQLSGLVTGFDGAMGYEQLQVRFMDEESVAERAIALAALEQWNLHLVAQNWAHLLLMGLLILGNISFLWRGPQPNPS